MPKHHVAALVYDNLCSFEFGCAAEVFGLPRPEMGDDWYGFSSCAVEPGPLRAMGGLAVAADEGLEALARADTIVVPGWEGADAEPSPALIDALKIAHSRGARMMTICSGVFVLAAAGLLKGRRVTTHWRYAAKLQARHPELTVDADVLYIDEGQILTSAGSAAGLDLCLHVVRRDFGPKIANQVAKRLVLAPHRNRGQAQFIERAVQPSQSGRLSELISALHQRLHAQPSLLEMAQAVGMSQRTFIRRFKDATGLTPGEWLVKARIERARELLEGDDHSVEDVARLSGFGAAATLRHHFRRSIGVSPAAYRGAFRGGQAA